jgi:hypothetical protein
MAGPQRFTANCCACDCPLPVSVMAMCRPQNGWSWSSPRPVPIVGASVEVKDAGDTVVLWGTTGTDGGWNGELADPDTYTITVSKTGYRTWTHTWVQSCNVQNSFEAAMWPDPVTLRFLIVASVSCGNPTNSIGGPGGVYCAIYEGRNCGLPGATVTLSGGYSDVATTDADGYAVFSVAPNDAGELEPFTVTATPPDRYGCDPSGSTVDVDDTTYPYWPIKACGDLCFVMGLSEDAANFAPVLLGNRFIPLTFTVTMDGTDFTFTWAPATYPFAQCTDGAWEGSVQGVQSPIIQYVDCEEIIVPPS